jgi:ABC-2 type transport system ATP-binding protein
MLMINHLSKQLGATLAVNDFSLDIEAGQLFGLLGPNGAGKTTLIRLIMGLLRSSSGEITLFDQYRPGDPAARNQIGYMPQQLAVYPGLSVLENLLFFGRLYQMEEDDLRGRAAELLEMVELTKVRDQLVATLSGGMVRRVMLATALIHRPRLLILDEPTAGVDPLLRIRFWEWFNAMVAAGTTLIVTTHNIAEARHCREVLFLRNGRLLEQGSPQSLNQKYGCDDLEAAFVAAVQRLEPAAVELSS